MLAEKGHKVTWWSSNFCHTSKSFRTQGQACIQVSDNCKIMLLKTPAYNTNVSLQRIWNHYAYARALRVEGEKCHSRPDVIIASLPPLLAANMALVLANRFGAKGIIDVQDIWPEAFEVAFPGRLKPVVQMVSLPLKRFADRVYDKADGVTAVSQTFLQRTLSVSKDKGKGIMVPLGVDLNLYRHCLGQPVGDVPYIKHDQSEFWAVYIGTIGKSYDVKTILEAAGRLGHTYPNIKFFIAGDGPDLSEMRLYAESSGLRNTTFTGLLSYLHLTHLLSQCDVGLNAIVASSRTSLPNKVFDYMAAGLPMINSVNGELGDLLRTEQFGVQYEAGNTGSLAQAILELHGNPQQRLSLGQKARRLAEERFDMNREYLRWHEFLGRIVPARAGSH